MFLLRKHKNAGKEEDKLGRALYEQQKYEEGEEVLWQGFEERKKMLSEKHANTHELGLALLRQQKYQKAEETFRQAYKELHKILTKKKEDTLDSKL